jgi:hypothetical protein
MDTIPLTVNGQVSVSKSDKLNAASVKESGNCDSESPINWFSSKSSRIKDHKGLITGDSYTRNCAANV